MPDHGSGSVMVHRLAFFQAPHQPERSSVGEPAGFLEISSSLELVMHKSCKSFKVAGPLYVIILQVPEGTFLQQAMLKSP